MINKALFILVALVFTVRPVLAQQPLPIQQILFYKNGMAYIVRAGDISAPLSLTFHPDEMNDVLETFTARNPDSGTLYAVGYRTGVPSDYMLSRFPFDLRGRNFSLADFLAQVRGAVLRMDLGGRTLEGTLATVATERRAADQQTLVDDHRLTLLLEDGAVRTEWLSDVRSLELEDPELAGQLRSYLSLLAEGRQDVTREISIYPVPAPGPIQVAYIEQFPVWMTSYRIDLSDPESRIQAWAQVDNPTGESWEGVDLTLVSGMPASFIMDLHEPLYASRVMVPVPGSDVMAPRVYEAATGSGRVPSAANTVYGTVSDAGGAALSEVEVNVRHQDSGQVRQRSTDSAGYSEVSGLAPGRLLVAVEHPGFGTFCARYNWCRAGKSA